MTEPLSFRGTLRPSLARVPPALLSPAAAGRLSELARRLPAGCSSCVFLEARLRAGAPRVDLILGIGPRGADLFGGGSRAGRPGTRRRTNTAVPGPARPSGRCWEPVRALLARWREPGSPLRPLVRNLWLEFDVTGSPAGSGRPRGPGVFVGYRDEVHRSAGPAGRERLAAQALDPLYAAGLPGAVRSGLAEVFRRLPPGVSAPYVGVMLQRDGRSARVCVSGVGWGELPGLLESVAWPGQVRDLDVCLHGAGGVVEGGRRGGPGLVHLDVGEGVGPRLGLELLLDRRPQVRGDGVPDGEVLDRLVAMGLCSPQKRRALDEWPGHGVEALGRDPWSRRTARVLNHVKFAFDGDSGSAEAKAYLAVHHLPARAPAPGPASRPPAPAGE